MLLNPLGEGNYVPFDMNSPGSTLETALMVPQEKKAPAVNKSRDNLHVDTSETGWLRPWRGLNGCAVIEMLMLPPALEYRYSAQI